MAMNKFKVEDGLLAQGNSSVEGDMSITGAMYIGNSNFEFNTNTITVSTATNTSIDQYPTANYKFADYSITVRNSSNTHFHSLKASVVNHGSNVFVVTYGEVWSNYALGNIDANVASGNVSVFFIPTANSVPLTVSTYRSLQA